MALNKAQILAVDDLPKKELEIPEWGGSVWVKTLSAHDFETALKLLTGPDQDNVLAKYAVLVCCDETGEPLFTSEDIPALAKKSGSALRKINEAASTLNFVTAAKVDEAEKS